ncbi:MAG TPA: hypothetical protein VFD02_05290 [Syntrophomonadaceae bacterium]|nr:hypothetical protein [Syntrophomonadaceae bacterium]
MNSMFRKFMYFGFGALTMTREKAEHFFNEMVEKGELSTDEAKVFVDDTIKKGEEEKSKMREMINSEFEKLKNDFSFVRQSEIKNIEARLRELEKKLNIE